MRGGRARSAGQASTSQRFRRLPRTIVYLWVFILFFIGYLVIDLGNQWDEAQTRARQLALSYVRLVEEHASGTFDRVNLMLEAVLHATRHEMGEGRSLDATTFDAPARARLDETLAALKGQFPGVGSIKVADAGGILVAASNRDLIGVSIAERAYFHKLQQLPGDAPVISDAFIGPIHHKWVVQMGRALRGPEGKFLGAVVVSLRVADYFLPVYQRLAVSPGLSIALVTDGRRVIARYPADDATIGRVVDPPSFPDILEPGHQELWRRAVSAIDGVDRLMAARRLPRYPMYSVAGLASDDYLAQWRQARDQAMMAGAGLLMAGLVVTLLARQRSTGEQLAASIYANSIEGILVMDPEGTILSVNPAFQDITGYQPDEVLGRNVALLRSDYNPPSFYEGLWRQLRSEGRWEGEVRYRRKDGCEYIQWQTVSAIPDRYGRTIRYVSVFNDITELRRNQEHVQHLAYHDPLTGLPNRLLLHDRLQHAVAVAKREDQRLALIYLDLDRFKGVNDLLGHEVGDALLRETAARLTGVLRASDTVARMGGDEFVLLLERAGSAEDLAQTADKILRAVAQPLKLAGEHLTISPSLGIAIYPDDGSDVATLLKHADTAMYAAKAGGRATYCFFSREMTDSAVTRLRCESELNTALEQGQFELHYQPKLRLADRSLCGVEALVRWRHPQRGLVGPGEFIPLAEETGQIVRLGAWVLEEACRQAAQWKTQSWGGVSIAVNVSSRQLFSGELAEHVAECIGRHGIRPQQLQIEITESSAMSDPERASSVLEGLRAMGCSIALDDFGTGYSSLAYLSRLPIDVIKIDRSFVLGAATSPENREIVRTILALGRSLGKTIVAEGVETEAHAAMLQAVDCEIGQGYLFGRPQPADQLRQSFADDLLTGAA